MNQGPGHNMQTRTVISTKDNLPMKKYWFGKNRVVSSQPSETMRSSFHQANGMATDHLTPYAAGGATNVIAVQRNHSRHMVNTFGPAVREPGQIVREMWAPKPSKITQHNGRYVEFCIFGPSNGFFWVLGGTTAWLSVCLYTLPSTVTCAVRLRIPPRGFSLGPSCNALCDGLPRCFFLSRHAYLWFYLAHSFR